VRKKRKKIIPQITSKGYLLISGFLLPYICGNNESPMVFIAKSWCERVSNSWRSLVIRLIDIKSSDV
jgi:hypothetical protein